VNLVIVPIIPRKRVTMRILPEHERKATAPTPDSWGCVACGVDTAPGFPGRPKMKQNFKRVRLQQDDHRSQVESLHGQSRRVETCAHEARCRVSVHWLSREAAQATAQARGLYARPSVQLNAGYLAIATTARGARRMAPSMGKEAALTMEQPLPLVRPIGARLSPEALQWLAEVERVFPGATKDIIIVRKPISSSPRETK
jgi:hypothetical protein